MPALRGRGIDKVGTRERILCLLLLSISPPPYRSILDTSSRFDCLIPSWIRSIYHGLGSITLNAARAQKQFNYYIEFPRISKGVKIPDLARTVRTCGPHHTQNGTSFKLAATVVFAEDVHPSQEKKTDDVVASRTAVDDSIYTRIPGRSLTSRSTNSLGNKDGIYNMRDITRPFSHSTSNGRNNVWNRKRGEKEAEDDDPGLQRAGDFKQKEVFHGRLLLWLSYQSIGAIYGDIETSPLYVYSSTFKEPPSYERPRYPSCR